MSRADDLVVDVEKAVKHPKALLFGALAAECRTPTETASEARERYGLSNEEEKLAKWVAVLKRDSQALFGKGYLEVLAEMTKKQGGEKVVTEILTSEDGKTKREIVDGKLRRVITTETVEKTFLIGGTHKVITTDNEVYIGYLKCIEGEQKNQVVKLDGGHRVTQDGWFGAENMIFPGVKVRRIEEGEYVFGEHYEPD